MKKILKTFSFFIVVAALVITGHQSYRRVLTHIYPTGYYEIVTKFAELNNLDRSLVFAVIKCESDFNRYAVSEVGAKGLMQITPDTFDWVLTRFKPDHNYTHDDLFDPEINIEAGSNILRLHLEEFGDVRVALAAYHAGRGSVNRWLQDRRFSSDGRALDRIPYGDTFAYVERVLGVIERYRGIYGIE